VLTTALVVRLRMRRRRRRRRESARSSAHQTLLGGASGGVVLGVGFVSFVARFVTRRSFNLVCHVRLGVLGMST
jgi:hypothetical protein